MQLAVAMMDAQLSLENTVSHSPMVEWTITILVPMRNTLGVQPALTALAASLHGPTVVLVILMEMNALSHFSTAILNGMDALRTMQSMDGVQLVFMPTQMNTTPTKIVHLMTFLILMMVFMRKYGTMVAMGLTQLLQENTVYQ